MPTTFNLQDLLKGDAAQLQSLFDTAALTLPQAPGLTLCNDLPHAIALIQPAINPAESLAKQLPALLAVHQLALAPALLLRVMVADKLVHTLFSGLDNTLQQELNKMALPLIRAIAQDDTLYSNAQQPVRQLLSEVSQQGYTWYPRDAKPHQQFLEKCQQLVEAVRQDTTEPALLTAIKQFRQWTDAEDKRARMLETRLCETEVAHLRLLAAECQVLDLLNRSLAGKTLPTALVEQLPILKSTLQHCLINDTAQAPFWKAWQRNLPILGTVFCTGDDVDEQQLYRDIPQLLNELERNLHLHQQRDTGDHYQDFVDNLGQHLMLAIQKKPLECSTVGAFAYPEGYTDNHTRVTSAVLQQAQTIETGDWIVLYGEDGQPLRCKLALKLPDVDQLLFVDRSGRKVTVKNLKDFSLCLSTGVAHKLKAVPVDEVIVSALKQLIALGDKHAEQYRQEAERQQAQVAAEKQAAAEKALAEARRLAAEKHQRTLAEQAAATQRKAEKKAALAAEQLAREQAATELVNTLNVGAWVEIIEPDKPALRCKLSVIISSTGKYIFVDQVGRKAAELHREQLFDGIKTQQIQVISKGDKFEDQLVKVIRGLRKDIS